MTEENIYSSFTSIDENDIEIIVPHSFTMNDQLEFVPDHFAIRKNEIKRPQQILVHNTKAEVQLKTEDSEDIEDETFTERLIGLTEMFPNWLRNICLNSFGYSKYIGQFIKKSLWFCGSSLMILVLPILLQLEFCQITETEAAQTREILLGPSAQLRSNFAFGQH